MKNLITKARQLFKKETSSSKEALGTVKNWYSERYESTLIQRNVLLLILVVAIVTIALCAFLIRYVKNTRSIEPFVIEIEKKSGIPTYVEPLTAVTYTANEAIKQYFILKYIRAREEFFYNSYEYNYRTVVRVLSSNDVYGRDYVPKFSTRNPNSPISRYGKGTTRRVLLKSISFPQQNAAQVRVAFQTDGIIAERADKVIYIEFDFNNLSMSQEERMINPLGFQVLNYTIANESEEGVK